MTVATRRTSGTTGLDQTASAVRKAEVAVKGRVLPALIVAANVIEEATPKRATMTA